MTKRKREIIAAIASSIARGTVMREMKNFYNQIDKKYNDLNNELYETSLGLKQQTCKHPYIQYYKDGEAYIAVCNLCDKILVSTKSFEKWQKFLKNNIAQRKDDET